MSIDQMNLNTGNETYFWKSIDIFLCGETIFYQKNVFVPYTY